VLPGALAEGVGGGHEVPRGVQGSLAPALREGQLAVDGRGA